MSDTKRKLGFYSLKPAKLRSEKKEYLSPLPVKNIFAFLDGLDEKARLMNRASGSKVHCYRKGKISGSIAKVLFISAKYNYSPPLIDKDTGVRRKSPKKLIEGEEEKTHVVFKFLDDEIIVLLEEHQAGISIGSLVTYLNSFEDKRFKSMSQVRPYRLEHFVIPKENFLDELSALDRAVVAEIHTSKRFLGSDCLDFSENTDEAKEDLVITAKAEKNRSIVQFCRDMYQKTKQPGSDITKLRVRGKTDDGNDIVLDTSIIRKIEYVDAQLQAETGVVKSKELFNAMAPILDEY